MKDNISKRLLIMLSNIQYIHELLTKPICEQTGLTKTAFDILMFIANCHDGCNAKDITQIKKIKPSLVSFHIERLVTDGYLKRKASDLDRRKVNLVCTQKADFFIKEDEKVQQEFLHILFDGISQDQLQTFKECLLKIDSNAGNYIKLDKQKILHKKGKNDV